MEMLLKVIKLQVLLTGGIPATFSVHGESFEAVRDKIWADGFIDGFDEDTDKKFRLKDAAFWGISEFDPNASGRTQGVGRILMPHKRVQ